MNCTSIGRHLGTASIAAIIALSLSAFGGCTPQPGAEPVTPVVTATPTPPPASPSAPAVTATPTPPPPSPSTPATTPSAAAKVTITSKTVAGHKLGSDEAKVVATLTQLLGEPTDHDEGRVCEVMNDPPYGSWYTFGPLTVSFNAKDGKSSSPRTLSLYAFPTSLRTDPRFTIAKDLPMDATFAKLAKLYPKGKTFDGPGPAKFFELPGGLVTYSGAPKATKPDRVRVGELFFCE